MRHQKYILDVGFKDSNRDKQLAYKIYYYQKANDLVKKSRTTKRTVSNQLPEPSSLEIRKRRKIKHKVSKRKE